MIADEQALFAELDAIARECPELAEDLASWPPPPLPPPTARARDTVRPGTKVSER